MTMPPPFNAALPLFAVSPSLSLSQDYGLFHVCPLEVFREKDLTTVSVPLLLNPAYGKFLCFCFKNISRCSNIQFVNAFPDAVVSRSTCP